MPEAILTAPVSNSAFLRELAQGAPNGSTLWVTSFIGTPDLTDAKNWEGKPFRPALMAGHVDGWGEENSYFSVAALNPTADGVIARRKANFCRLLALVVDDVQLDDVAGRVSYVLATSPGKHQIGILIDGNDRDAADRPLVDRLVTTMADRGFLRADTSGNNSVRYVRLPVGQNQKPRDAGHWRHQLQQWNPSVRLSLADAASAFGIDLDELRGEVAHQAETPGTGRQDELLRMLTANIVRGERLHESINEMSASLVATGMPPGAVVNTLRGLMESSHAAHDDRWLARYNDISRSVQTAQAKFGRVFAPLVAQPEETAAAAVPLLSMQQLQQSAANVTWSIKHILPAESVGMMFGAPGTFKSFIALDMALHIAHGMAWMGKKTKQGPVIYVAAEGGTGLWRRIQAWHQLRGLDWSKAPLFVVPVAVAMRSKAGSVVEAAKQVGVVPNLVVVDTLSQTFEGEENSATDMASYLTALGVAFRELWKCAVMVIHHSGHGATERPRGSSATIGNTDYLFGVFRDEKQLLATLTCERQKDGDQFKDQMFELSSELLGKDEDGDEIRSLAARHINPGAETAAALVRQVNAGRGGRTQQLIDLADSGMLFKTLRADFYAALGDLAQDAKQKAFVRAWCEAKDAGKLEAVDGRVIVAKPVDNSVGGAA